MILVIGGANQGKREYVKERFQADMMLDSADMLPELLLKKTTEIGKTQVLYHLELLVKEILKRDLNVREMMDGIIKENPDLIIVSQELGYGLVPMDAFERKYREEHGRLCTYLAAKADEVHRVFCGIGTVIKG